MKKTTKKKSSAKRSVKKSSKKAIKKSAPKTAKKAAPKTAEKAVQKPARKPDQKAAEKTSQKRAEVAAKKAGPKPAMKNITGSRTPASKPLPKKETEKSPQARPGASVSPLPRLKTRVVSQIRASLNRIGALPPETDILVEYARDEKFGDYACTTAMDRRVRDHYAANRPDFRNPQKFAAEIGSGLASGEPPLRAEVAGPGFLNISVPSAVLWEYVQSAVQSGDVYGRTQPVASEKIVFEFVSANPTGPLNVVSARAAALGDSCCNLLDAAGHRVHREYYVNDYGNQVSLLGESCLLRALQTRGVPLKFAHRPEHGPALFPSGPGLPFPVEGYHGEYLIEIVEEVLREKKDLIPSKADIEAASALAAAPDNEEDVLHKLGLTDKAHWIGRATTEHFLSTHKRDLESFRVQFDNFFRETSLHDAGSVLAVRDRLSKFIENEGGREIFKSTAFGDDKDRVIVREDGRPTYLLADIAYHETKMKRGFDRILNIWGPDHHGYIKRLAGAMQALGFPADRFRVLIAQQVNLLDGGKPMVMSKRAGQFITMKSLLEEIPVDVVRYFFVMRSFESHLDFDFTEAKDTSEKNPYYYVAYAHARIRSIFRKAEERGLKPLEGKGWENPPLELSAERRRLMWLVARFPEEVADAAESLEPHRLVTYLYQIATALSRFYAPKENKIIEQDPRTAAALLSILTAVAVCLKNGLRLLGMTAPERMVREDAPVDPAV